MTVFVVMFYGIDEAELEAVFASRELAEAYIIEKRDWGDWLQIREEEVRTA